MYISEIEISKLRAFTEPATKLYLGRGVTAIAGHNGVGKSTILAALGNCGHLPKQLGVHLNGDGFSTELSEVLTYDPGFDATGGIVNIAFKEDDSLAIKNIPPTGILSFRTALQKPNKPSNVGDTSTLTRTEDPRTRFRLIPKKAGRPDRNERKLQWPTYYLGLSRLFPVGETDEYLATKKKLTEDILAEYSSVYKRILGLQDSIESLAQLTIAEAPRKKGVPIETENYGFTANSAGQDNVGQIVLSALSFKRLKQQMGDAWSGGLLLIDELDATLHPVAQEKLYKFLTEVSRDCGFQIVFTTHSLYLIQQVLKVCSPQNDFTRLCYLRRKDGCIDVLDNPSFRRVEADLNNEIVNGVSRENPRVFLEDGVAGLVFRLIHEHHIADCPVEVCDSSLGWTQILAMFNAYPNLLGSALVVLDPDVAVKDPAEIQKQIPQANLCLNADDRFRLGERSIMFLPGEKPIEEQMFTFYEQEGPECVLYSNSELDEMNVSYSTMMDMDDFQGCTGGEVYKQWYNRIPVSLRETVVKFWLDSNSTAIQQFAEEFRENYAIAVK